ncbi:PIN domain-like protein, partial [Mycena galopus ATCC 62051]
ILDPAVETKSLLNLATIEGFRNDNRGLCTFILGVDISAITAALTAAGVLNSGPAGQKLILEKLFYQLCNLSLAPLTLVFVFDGPGRPSVKRGIRVVNRPTWLTEHLKLMITSFGYHFYDAPGEAEAELARLNAADKIDGILTEDSDAFVFGARLVIRTLGSSVQHGAAIYSIDSIENTESTSMDRPGLLLCTLLLGGDYDSVLGFGRDLVNILTSSKASDINEYLATWRNAVRTELQTNSSGRLDKRHPKLAAAIPDTFPDLKVVEFYMNPLTSASPHYTGTLPDFNSWKPREPVIHKISSLCSSLFGWHSENLLKKLNSNVWPAVVFKMISSARFDLLLVYYKLIYF